MRIFIILTVFFVFRNLSAFSEYVSPDIAEKVAINFYAEKKSLNVLSEYKSLNPTLAHKSVIDGLPVYYIFNFTGGGYVIVSAEDAVFPVPGFSLTGYYEHSYCPPAFLHWMEDFERQIVFIRKNAFNKNTDAEMEWKRLLNADFDDIVYKINVKTVAPLIHTTWDQGKYYNDFCPYDVNGPGNHVWAGCVPVAMAQIMNYYRWPKQGIGSYSYFHPDYDTITADFENTFYYWNEMPSQLNSYNDALAELLFHLGVSVDLDYGPGGSGMYNHKAAYALRTYFGYSQQTEYVFRDTCSLNWKNIILQHLDNGIPLYYAGWADTVNVSGHAFVCDGYQDTNYFHFNWGWSGAYNGYFIIDNLTPAGADFTLDHELIINIIPEGDYPDFCSHADTFRMLQGIITDGSGPLNDYQNNSDCYYLISPSDSVNSITIDFKEFCTVSPEDKIIVYDGNSVNDPVIATYSGCNIPSQISSTGHEVLLHFISDSNTTAPGWLLEYSTTLPVFCSGIQTLNASSGVVGDGSVDCNYNYNSFCRWKIEPPEATAIIFHVNMLDIANGDSLIIYDLENNVKLAKLTGNSIPPDILCPSGLAYLYFRSDGKYNANGWEINYYESSGLPGLYNENNINIFPNPVDDILFVKSNNPDFYKLSVRLIFPDGREVYNFISASEVTEIDVSDLLPGIYFVQVFSEDFIEVHPVLVY